MSFLTWAKVLHGGLEAAVLVLAAPVVVVVLAPLGGPLRLGHVEADVEVPMRVDLLVVPLRQTQPVARTQAQP